MNYPEYLEEPAYTAAFASRLVGLRPERVRRWLRGYEYKYARKPTEPAIRRKQRPVISRKHRADQAYASFLDLIDLLFVKAFVTRGVSIQRLRRALTEAGILLGDEHFAQRRFWTDGRNIYLEVQGKADALLHLLSGGQWAIAPIIKQIAVCIDFHEQSGVAERWYPLGREGQIVVDPTVSFGAPTIVGRGTETANVYDLFLAERKNVSRVSSWMELAEPEVESAVKFEETLRAA